MKLASITLGLVAFATLGTSALAAPPDIARRQTEIRSALAPFKFNLSGDRAQFTPQGRRDLVMVTPEDRAEMVEDLKTAFRQKRDLPNGYRIAGWAHVAATGSYTFTVKHMSRNENHVVELFEDPAGTRVKIWGSINAVGPKPAPRFQVPSRFSPARLDPIVR